MAATALPKETKAQKVERLKREKNPWDALDEIRAFAQNGRATIPEEWNLYFKWWGIYTQGDGLGVTGGKGGEGRATEYFMLRIGIPNGILTAHQARTIGQLAQQHARNLVDITVRQNIQLHWLTVESLPQVIRQLDAIGLSPRGACGDVVRNVTGCPLAGIAHDELLDASPLALAVADELNGNSDFYNLPRKFKISISGCPVWCAYPEINDIGLTAVRRGDEIGYSLRVGGGLSTEPHLSVRLNAFIPQDQALGVIRTIAEIFRDQQGLRESRDRARMKYLFLKEGWTADRFLAAIEARLGIQFDPAPEESIPDDILRDHVGMHRQKQDGLSYVGASVLRGRLSGDQFAAAADLAQRYGTGRLRATVMQNLLFLDVPSSDAPDLARDLGQIGLHVDGSQFWRGGIACTGTEFCKLAITETKGFLRWLVDQMEERLPQFDQQLRLHVTGCPNSCGQHWIADIGLEGKKIKHQGQLTDAYYFCLGGSVGLHAATARPVGFRTPAPLVPDAIERLLRRYLAERASGENLRAYFARHSDESLRAALAGQDLAPVERDQPSGHVPAGVAG
ncbi:MAG TPA: nitrite/sulfite reductase [Acidobacteriaceae bacterium]|jgi:sulfite reductase (ferredoxin)|nr:nitrite/sulfite reductase [Acidobacteriaceae bacterium]